MPVSCDPWFLLNFGRWTWKIWWSKFERVTHLFDKRRVVFLITFWFLTKLLIYFFIVFKGQFKSIYIFEKRGVVVVGHRRTKVGHSRPRKTLYMSPKCPHVPNCPHAKITTPFSKSLNQLLETFETFWGECENEKPWQIFNSLFSDPANLRWISATSGKFWILFRYFPGIFFHFLF